MLLLTRTWIAPCCDPHGYVERRGSDAGSVCGSLQEALKILNLDLPVDIYVKQNPIPNAYTMAMQVLQDASPLIRCPTILAPQPES